MPRLPTHQLKLLVIGSGGREHALAWKLAQSPLVEQVFCAPGNGGTAQENKTQNIDIDAFDFPQLSQFCLDHQIDLSVVGPDNVLASGIVNYFKKNGLRIFGPTKEAAQLEWSKSYAKDFMARNHLPTAKFKVCKSYDEACYIADQDPSLLVVKADGLALGKGVYVCNNNGEVKTALKEIFQENKFGQAGETVVLEEKLNGEEISLFLLSDGKQFISLAPSQDYKRRFDDHQGPNTGGMGAISPPPSYGAYQKLIETNIVAPLMVAFKKEQINYQGLLYLGLILHRGKNSIEPKILEFNCRFGDPETQVVLPRLQSDLLPALWACTEGTLSEIELCWTNDAGCTIVAVAKDYPEKSSQGKPITISQPTLGEPQNTFIFHAGTKLLDRQLVTSGGRILAVTALAENLESAAKQAYATISHIQFEDIAYRQDIGRTKSRIS